MRRRIAIAIAWFTCLAGAIGLVVAATTGGGLADDSAGFEHTVAVYTEDLRDQVHLGAISAHTVAAVDAAVRPRGTSLWLREPGR